MNNKDGIESIEGLADHINNPRYGWAMLGKKLKVFFRHSKDIRISTSAAGAIPYYSRFQALDMLGLTDSWIASNGILTKQEQPGHSRVAPFHYLEERNVHLILGHPFLKWASPQYLNSYSFDSLQKFRFLVDLKPKKLPPDASIIEMPLGNGLVLAMLYLTPHQAVEQAIAQKRCRKFSIDRRIPD